MSKKLSGNGLWESSRMMLPQHKERIIADHIKETRRKKPILHEDEWEDMARNIAEYAHDKEIVAVTTFGEYEDEVFEGIIKEVSERRKALRLASELEDRWITLSDIVGVVRIR